MSAGPCEPKSALLLLCVVLAAAPVWADAPREYCVDIARQPLLLALQELVRQGSEQFAYLPEDANTPVPLVGPLKGCFTTEAARNMLLASIGWKFESTNPTTITLVPPKPKPAPRHASIAAEHLRDARRLISPGYAYIDIEITSSADPDAQEFVKRLPENIGYGDLETHLKR